MQRARVFFPPDRSIPNVVQHAVHAYIRTYVLRIKNKRSWKVEFGTSHTALCMQHGWMKERKRDRDFRENGWMKEREWETSKKEFLDYIRFVHERTTSKASVLHKFLSTKPLFPSKFHREMKLSLFAINLNGFTKYATSSKRFLFFRSRQQQTTRKSELFLSRKIAKYVNPGVNQSIRHKPLPAFLRGVFATQGLSSFGPFTERKPHPRGKRSRKQRRRKKGSTRDSSGFNVI